MESSIHSTLFGKDVCDELERYSLWELAYELLYIHYQPHIQQEE